jgi:hypothetical protein
MRQVGISALAGVVFTLITLLSAPVQAQAVAAVPTAGHVHPAALHVEKLGGEVVAVLSNGSLSRDQRITYFQGVLTRDLDIPLIARFGAGRHRCKASPAERRAYLRAFWRLRGETLFGPLWWCPRWLDRPSVSALRGLAAMSVTVQ